MLSTISTPCLSRMVAANFSTRSALVGRSGLPPLYAATTLTRHSGCVLLNAAVNAGTWDVSVPMMPARRFVVAHAGGAEGGAWPACRTSTRARPPMIARTRIADTRMTLI